MKILTCLISIILLSTCLVFAQTFEQVDSTLAERVKSGADSMQIKVVMRPTITINKDLTIIAKSKDGWYGEIYRFEHDRVYENPPTTKIFYLKTKYILRPKKSWQEFISELYQLNVLNLVGKECLVLDGTLYTFIIITQSASRVYEYYCYGNKPMDNEEKVIRLIHSGMKRKKVS